MTLDDIRERLEIDPWAALNLDQVYLEIVQMMADEMVDQLSIVAKPYPLPIFEPAGVQNGWSGLRGRLAREGHSAPSRLQATGMLHPTLLLATSSLSHFAGSIRLSVLNVDLFSFRNTSEREALKSVNMKFILRKGFGGGRSCTGL